MSREIDPIQAEAWKNEPDWPRVAHLIAEQPGCEDFPVATVDKILDRPGELLVGTIPRRESTFVIGAMIAAKERPFAIAVDDDGVFRTLKIEPARKEVAPGHFMYAEREIGFDLRPKGVPNFMGPGIYGNGSNQHMMILAADVPSPELAIGTDDVNAYFERRVQEERLAPHKVRMVGALFHVALLAVEFDAPTPVAPDELQPALSRAKLYYQAAEVLARTIADARKTIATIEDKLELHDRSVLPRPAIHFEKPLELPTLDDMQKISRILGRSPTDTELRNALRSYQKAISVLDALSSE